MERGHSGALAGAVAALVAQQLSCGYYLIYFTPFVAMYLLWEITARRRWRDLRLLASIAAAAVTDVILTWPFLSPYLQLRGLGFPARSLRQVAEYSADTRAYLAVHETNRVWGRLLENLPRPENELFPGLLPVVLAGIGLVALARWRWTATTVIPAEADARRWLAPASLLVAAIGAVSAIAFVGTGGINVRVAAFKRSGMGWVCWAPAWLGSSCRRAGRGPGAPGARICACARWWRW